MFLSSCSRHSLRSYRSGQTRFLRFCHEVGLQSLPVSEQVLCWFVAKLGSESLSYQTIKCYLSATALMAGYGDPFSPGDFPVLQYVLCGGGGGVRRTPWPPTQPRLPITPQVLRHIKNQWASHGGEADYMMLWAACCVFYFGFMRAGEFTARPAEDSPSLIITYNDFYKICMCHLEVEV